MENQHVIAAKQLALGIKEQLYNIELLRVYEAEKLPEIISALREALDTQIGHLNAYELGEDAPEDDNSYIGFRLGAPEDEM